MINAQSISLADAHLIYVTKALVDLITIECPGTQIKTAYFDTTNLV